jgi:riboflavin kinase/FMN adenylyltransferase
MKVIEFSLGSTTRVMSSHVYAIGMFDGVHLGHQMVIRTAKTLAQTLGRLAGVVTFDRHPSVVLGRTQPGFSLMTYEQRLEALADCGLDTAVVLKFDEAMAEMPPDAFVREVLHDRLSLCGAVVGTNHSFGRGASGQVADLERIGAEMGFGVRVVPPVVVDGVVVSSTLIRNLLHRGDVAEACKYLGRPFAIKGRVIEGRHLGRQLGFPTMNLRPDPEQVVPARGVYIVSVVIEGDPSVRWGICNVGLKPTVPVDGLLVEVHVLDYENDEYGQTVDVSFVHYLRSETRFPSLPELRQAISADERSAREWLASTQPREAHR